MNLKSKSILKVKRLLAVVVSLSILIFTFTINSFAYTVSQEGVNKLYVWDEWDGTQNKIYSLHNSGQGNPTFILSANAFGYTARQNGGVDVASTPLNESINYYNSNQNIITIWVAGDRDFANATEVEQVVFSASTGNTDVFSTKRDFTIQLEYQTILDADDTVLNDHSSLRLYNGQDQVYNLTPSYSLVESIPSTPALPQPSDRDFVKVSAFFVVDNYDQELVTFDRIDVQLSCDINTPPEGYMNRYRISVGNLELYEYTPQEVLDQIEAQQAANDDLILKLGEINELDQAELDADKAKAEESKGKANELLNAEAELDVDVDSLDFSASESITEGSAVSQTYWNIFFNDKSLGSYLTEMLTIVVLISSLSLVLYGLKK